MSKRFNKLDSNLVFDGKWEKVYENRYQDTSDGHEFTYLTFAPHHAGSIFAVTPDEKVVLTRQYRFGIEDWMIELPGGKVDEGEDKAKSAIRELKEETGYEVEFENLTYLGESYPRAHRSSSKHELFIATHARKVSEPKLDREEDIETILMSLDELRDRIESGEIKNVLLQAMYYRYLSHKEKLAHK